jgi:hypothetical protein
MSSRMSWSSLAQGLAVGKTGLLSTVMQGVRYLNVLKATYFLGLSALMDP